MVAGRYLFYFFCFTFLTYLKMQENKWKVDNQIFFVDLLIRRMSIFSILTSCSFLFLKKKRSFMGIRQRM